MPPGCAIPAYRAVRLYLCEDHAMGNFNRIAPIFAVRDLGVALEHYERMGFKV